MLCLYVWALGHTSCTASWHWFIIGIGYTVWMYSEILADSFSTDKYIMGLYYWALFWNGMYDWPWNTGRSPGSGCIPISQPRLHRAHPARREAKTNRRNFHFNRACLVFCWLILSKTEAVYLLFLDPLSCQRCLLQVWGPDNFRSNIDHIFTIL